MINAFDFHRASWIAAMRSHPFRFLSYRRPPTLSSAAGNDGKQQVGGARPSCEYRVRSRVVVGRIVRVRCAADAVARLNIEPDAMTFLEDHRGRPDLDVDGH